MRTTIITDEFIITGSHTPEKQAIARQMRRSMTVQEDALWQRVRGSKLDRLHFRRQQVVDGFIADFYCHAARLIVEVDGAVHNSQAEYDAERGAILAARGLKVLRVSNADIETQIDAVLIRIREATNAQVVTLTPLPSEGGGRPEALRRAGGRMPL